MMFNTKELKWTREPKEYTIKEDCIEIVTNPHTDLWQRTYYHFRNDNAPVLQMKTDEKFFSFVVKTEFESKHRFDQCGIVMYLDSDNWIKGSIEYENDRFQHLGSVVTNNGAISSAQHASPKCRGCMEFLIAQAQTGPVNLSTVLFTPDDSMLLIIAEDQDMNSSALIATAWGYRLISIWFPPS